MYLFFFCESGEGEHVVGLDGGVASLVGNNIRERSAF